MSDQETKPTIITNYVEEETPVGDTGKTKTVRYALPLSHVAEQITTVVPDVAQCQDRLFVPVEDDEGTPDVRYVDDWTGLSTHLQAEGHRTSWQHQKCAVPGAERDVHPVQRDEVLTHLRHTVDAYDAVEAVPHWPPRGGAYYLRSPEDYPEGDGSTLERFVDLFCPDSDEDRALIKALIVSPMWGSKPGKIPLFTVTSDHGVGSGKSSTIEAVSALYGGFIDTDSGDGQKEFQLALGYNPQRRIVRIDNVKGRTSKAAWESMITSPEVRTRRHREAARMTPNRWVWCLTANLANLSTDLASRAVVIKIGKINKAVNFQAQYETFLERHHKALVGDILAFLKSDPVCEIPKGTASRWQAWEQAVLSRMPNGAALCDLIRSRRSGVDGDTADAMEARHTIESVLTGAGFDPQRHNVLIPCNALSGPFSEALDERMTARKVGAYLSGLLRTEPLRHVDKGRPRCGRENKKRRGIVWTPNGDTDEIRYFPDGPPRNTGDGTVIGFPDRSSSGSGPHDHQGSSPAPAGGDDDGGGGDTLPGGLDRSDIDALMEDVE